MRPHPRTRRIAKWALAYAWFIPAIVWVTSIFIHWGYDTRNMFWLVTNGEFWLNRYEGTSADISRFREGLDQAPPGWSLYIVNPVKTFEAWTRHKTKAIIRFFRPRYSEHTFADGASGPSHPVPIGTPIGNVNLLNPVIMKTLSLPIAPIALAFLIPVIIRIFRNRRPIPPGHCTKCGYNLTGNISGICPECGTPCEVAAVKE